MRLGPTGDLQGLGSSSSRSPLGLDIYVWLTYRISYLKRPTLIPWQALQVQFGSDYSRLRDFQSHAVAQLEKVIRVYPTLRLSQADIGLRLYPSPPHVGRAEVPTPGLGPGTMSLDLDGPRSRTA